MYQRQKSEVLHYKAEAHNRKKHLVKNVYQFKNQPVIHHMRILLLLFILTSSVVNSQEKTMQFGSEILTYHQIGYTIKKHAHMIITDSKGVDIKDRDSCYQVLYDGGQEHSVTTAYVRNGDTLFQQYHFKFISLPLPEIRWTAMEQFAIRDPYNNTGPVIGLHKDSLAYFKDFEIHHFVPDVPELKWEVMKGELIASGLHTTMPFNGGNSLPDVFIDSLKKLKDTIFVTLQLTIRAEDGVFRKKSGSIMLVKMDGLAYDLHRDPSYYYHHFSDTVEITKKQLYSADSLVFHNPGRLFLKIPRLEKNYFFDWISDNQYCYYVPPLKVEAGKGFIIIDAGNTSGAREFVLTDGQAKYTWDYETGAKTCTNAFARKKIFCTYPSKP